MQQYLPELIRLNVPFIFLLGIGLCAALISIWLYKKTVPPIPLHIKYVIGALRIIIAFLVIFLFFSPQLFLTFKELQKPEIALFVDNSQSMGYMDVNNDDRWQETISTIRQIKDILPDNVTIHWYQFNSNIEEINGDSINITKAGTNFSSVIKTIKNNKFDKAIIISDGNNTEGDYPLSDDLIFNTITYTVGVGRVTEGKDIFISNVSYQPVAYQNRKQTIEVQIGNRNLNKREIISVKLIHGTKNISTKLIEANKEDSEQNIFFEYTPQEKGLNRFKIMLDKIDGEANYLNNNFIYVQDILKNKLRIGVFSGSPNYDSKFISLLLKRNENFEVDFYVEDRQGNFILNQDMRKIDSLDVIIFQEYPGSFTKTAVLDRLLQNFRERIPAFIIFLGNNTNRNLLNRFKNYLPYAQLPNPISAQELSILSIPVTKIIPVLNIFEQSELNFQFWNKIPPVKINFSGGKLRNNSNILLEGKIGNKLIPLAVTYEEKNIKTALFNGSGFWKWHFLLQDQHEFREGYTRFLNQLVRWVSNKSKLKPVILETSKKIVHTGEAVRLKGYLYNANYEPIIDGNLLVQVNWEKQQFSVETSNDSTGRYFAEFVPPGEGRYRIIAKGFKDGAELGSDQLQLEVIPFEKEFIRIEQNVNFLKKFAETGNGFYVSSSGVDSLRNALIMEDTIIQKDKIIEIWYAPFMLFLIIFLITLEWILRKRYGLV